MKVLVIGSGGREHALVWKLSQSSGVSKLWCAPGNPGIETLAECVPLKAADIPGLLHFAAGNAVDLAVVGPEQPLAGGIVDAFDAHGLMIFGPSRMAARLEWSKAFAKDFMSRHGIPTAAYRTFVRDDYAGAREYILSAVPPVVLKADGLAAGKGVVVCRTREEALSALESMMNLAAFGAAGEKVVVEQFLDGEEASVFAVCDGKDYVMLAPAQDHKRVFDGDSGKNTGGMGAYAPAPVVDEKVARAVEREIIGPTLLGMAADGHPYKGCLYAGLMITGDGPRVIEYNSRFGDPETQVVLPLYDGDLSELLVAGCTGGIAELKRRLPSPRAGGSAVCIVLASPGYPDDYPLGLTISGLEALSDLPGIIAFHAGTRRQDGAIVSAGGRVLGITAVRSDGSLAQTIDLAYEAVKTVSFQGMHFRHDIGRKAIAR